MRLSEVFDSAHNVHVLTFELTPEELFVIQKVADKDTRDAYSKTHTTVASISDRLFLAAKLAATLENFQKG